MEQVPKVTMKGMVVEERTTTKNKNNTMKKKLDIKVIGYMKCLPVFGVNQRLNDLVLAT